MADNYDDTFENLQFDENLEQILVEIFDEAQLAPDGDDIGLKGEQNDGDNSRVILSNAEAVHQVRTDLRHEPDNVTPTTPTQGPCSAERLHTPTTTCAVVHAAVISSPTPRMYGRGQARKRVKLTDQETEDIPSTSRLRASENNEQDRDERGLTAWTDSMIHAWDQASFTGSESEEEQHEIPRELFRERDLNRRLDHDALNRVNRYFERVFDLAGQPLSYREVEEIVANAQADVISILRNIIACQQQHTEALRHAAEFWRRCHEQLYNEFTDFRQSMNVVPHEIQEIRTLLRDVRTEQNLTVNALSLISERLNVIQTMTVDMYNRMMGRR